MSDNVQEQYELVNSIKKLLDNNISLLDPQVHAVSAASISLVEEFQVQIEVLKAAYMELQRHDRMMMGVATKQLARIFDLEDQLRWVPIDEELPPYTKPVFLLIKGDGVVWKNSHTETGYSFKDGWWIYTCIGLEQAPEGCVTHWRHLPEATKVEK